MNQTRTNVSYYAIKRFQDIKKEYEEIGQDDKINYLSRLSELHYLCLSFDLEEIDIEIRDYMNTNF